MAYQSFKDASGTTQYRKVTGAGTTGDPAACHQIIDSGSVDASQAGTWNITNISGTVSLPTGASTAANQTTIIGHVDGIETLLGTIDADTGSIATSTTSIDGKITACNTGAVVLAAGTAAFGKLAANSGVTIGAVEIAAAQTIAVTGTFWQATQPVSLTSTTITGTVAVTQSGTWNITNAGTFAVQVDGAALTSLQLIDDGIATAGSAITTKGMAAAGTDGTNARIIKTDSSGELQVDVLTLPALAAGTNGIGKLTSNSGVTIGAVEIAATQTLTTVTTVGTVTTLTGGGIAHDGVDSGNPHKIGAKATTSLSGVTLVSSADRTDLYAGVDGVQITRPHCNLEDIVSERVTNTDGASTAFASGLAAPGAGVRLYLTSLIICNSSAAFCTVDIRDGSAGSVLATVPVPASSGVIFNPPVPLKFSANTAVAYDASAATTTLTITGIGFKSKV